MITAVSIKRSPVKGKKYRATVVENGVKTNIDFGAKGYSDYTKHKDPERQKRYIARHKANEDWTDWRTPGYWSRWLLWESPDFEKAKSNIVKKLMVQNKN